MKSDDRPEGEQWQMPEWERDLNSAIGFPLHGDISHDVHTVLEQLHTAGLLLAREQKRGWDSLLNKQAATKLGELRADLARLNAEAEDASEALQRESRAVADANREVTRLKAENEQLLLALKEISICDADEPCNECHRVAMDAIGGANNV